MSFGEAFWGVVKFSCVTHNHLTIVGVGGIFNAFTRVVPKRLLAISKQNGKKAAHSQKSRLIGIDFIQLAPTPKFVLAPVSIISGPKTFPPICYSTKSFRAVARWDFRPTSWLGTARKRRESSTISSG